MCTRVLYQGTEDVVLTARGMDWNDDMRSNMVILPRNVQYISHVGKNPITWTSKYGSVAVFGYNAGGTDGINEKGLAVNLLYLVESDYGNDPQAQDLCIVQWVQFSLDLFATVAEAVEYYRTTKLNIVSGTLPNGRSASMHLSVSDSSGDSAIFEYQNGKLQVHHNRNYTVMTNSPPYNEQLSLSNYWKNINGMTFLPGSISAADRFVRTTFFLNIIPKSVDKNYISALPEQTYHQQAIASVLGVIRSAGVPLGIQDPEKPNISSTLWRTLSDHKSMVYYFDSATSPSIFWVDMKNIDFANITSAMMLPNIQSQLYAGDMSHGFVKYTLPSAQEINQLIKF